MFGGLLLVMTMLRYETIVSKVVFDEVMPVDSLRQWIVQGCLHVVQRVLPNPYGIATNAATSANPLAGVPTRKCSGYSQHQTGVPACQTYV